MPYLSEHGFKRFVACFARAKIGCGSFDRRCVFDGYCMHLLPFSSFDSDAFINISPEFCQEFLSELSCIGS